MPTNLTDRLGELVDKVTQGPCEFDGNCGGYITNHGDKIARAYARNDAEYTALCFTHKDEILSALRKAEALSDICSDRVLAACSAAKAVPGPVWGQGAEGHYAFLCGLAALLGNESAGLNEIIADQQRRAEAFALRHPEIAVTHRCPDRILIDLGFDPARLSIGDEK